MSCKYLVNLHQFFGGIRLFFRERNKLDRLRISSLVSKRGLNCVEVVCTYGDQPASPPNVLMKLVLKVNERCIGTGGELQIAKDCASKQRTNALSLIITLKIRVLYIQSRGARQKTYVGMDMDCQKAVFSAWREDESVLWGFCFSQKDFERTGYAFYAKEIISSRMLIKSSSMWEMTRQTCWRVPRF